MLNVIVCRGPVCGDRRGAAQLLEHLQARVAARGLTDRVSVREEICLGHCLRGPNILVAEGDAGLAGLGGASGGGVLYNHMTLDDVDRVVERHLVGGMAVRTLTNLPPVPMGSPKRRPP
jgi:(2Fe-2S) ferredoxin